jgi:hypothetical protein
MKGLLGVKITLVHTNVEAHYLCGLVSYHPETAATECEFLRCAGPV